MKTRAAVAFEAKKPLEIVATRQWYIRNGGRDEDLREALLARGKQLAFHPDFMRVRYENWVGGLNGDWLVSRQRFFGGFKLKLSDFGVKIPEQAIAKVSDELTISIDLVAAPKGE